MEISEIGTLQEIPIWPANPSTGSRRRGPLRSRTVDTLLHILSICYDDSSQISQSSDKGDLVTKDDGIIPNNSLHQEETNVETRAVLGTQKEGLCDTHLEPIEQDHNISEEGKDVEEGEISGEFTNSVLEDEDFVGTESGFEKNHNLTPLSINTVDDVSKDMAVVISKPKRNLVDYSEIALHGKSMSANHEIVPLLRNSGTKNQDFASPIKDKGTQNNKKRKGSSSVEKGTNKKARKSVDQSTSLENLTIGETQEAIDASANKNADTKKKKRGALTAERKQKKKRKDRIKRAEKNRKLGVKRLKLKPVIKEKKITYCRHYINGRCHEGANCKFSHDTTPLTKSKPCCHFARHTCMKGDECPFDHQLSKYPCNNYLSKGFCPRGSDCMFSHEAQKTEATLNAPNESTQEQKPPNSSPKLQIPPKLNVQTPKGVNSISREKTETKSSPQIPKLAPQIPKGISFLSQEKLPLEAHLSPKVNSEVKESSEITKTPPVIPRGINFLSFGKKPDMDSSSGGFTFKIGKSPLSKPEGIIVNVDDGVKVSTQIGNNNENKEINLESSTDGKTSSKKPMTVLPFLSSASQRTLQSTLAFAAKFDSGVKSTKLGI